MALQGGEIEQKVEGSSGKVANSNKSPSFVTSKPHFPAKLATTLWSFTQLRAKCIFTETDAPIEGTLRSS